MQFPAVARRRSKDHGGDRRVMPAIVHGGLGPHDVKGGGKGVGLRGRGGQDRDREHALGRPAGARIEDVAIAPPPMAKRLELRPRRAQGPVVQFDLPQPPLVAKRILDADRPWRDGSTSAFQPDHASVSLERLTYAPTRGRRHCYTRHGRESRKRRRPRDARPRDRPRSPCRCCRDSTALPGEGSGSSFVLHRVRPIVRPPGSGPRPVARARESAPARRAKPQASQRGVAVRS